jgi:hypothetical protein
LDTSSGNHAVRRSACRNWRPASVDRSRPPIAGNCSLFMETPAMKPPLIGPIRAWRWNNSPSSVAGSSGDPCATRRVPARLHMALKQERCPLFNLFVANKEESHR